MIQLDKLESSQFAMLNNLMGFSLMTNKLKSSAKSLILDLVKEHAISLIKRVNKRGPRTVPWGIPHVVFLRGEVDPLIAVNWGLSSRYDRNHSRQRPLKP